jgi:hypothetical protein
VVRTRFRAIEERVESRESPSPGAKLLALAYSAEAAVVATCAVGRVRVDPSNCHRRG